MGISCEYMLIEIFVEQTVNRLSLFGGIPADSLPVPAVLLIKDCRLM